MKEKFKEISFEEMKKLSKSTWTISLLYSVFFVLGKYAMSEKYIDFANFKVYLLIFLTFLPINLICILLYNFLDNLQKNRKERKEIAEPNKTNKSNIKKTIFKSDKIFLIIFIAMIFLWIPQWISLFPGCFNYDATEIWKQYLDNEFIEQYPPLYSIILVSFLKMSLKISGGYILGIATYTILQMIISAGIFTYSIYVLEKYKASKWIKIFAFIYYAIFPAIYLYVLSFTKDTLFNCFFYLSFLLYLEFFKEKDEFFSNKRWIILIISNLIFLLLRRNAIYAYVIFSIILAITILPKMKNILKTTLVIVLPVILFFTLNNWFYRILNIQKSTDASSMLSVPVQQIAYVYNNNRASLNEEQINKILQIAEKKVIENYYPESSDSILYYTKTSEIIKNGKEFFKLWIDIGKNNISNYLNAIVKLDYGYFYPDAIQKVYLRNDSYEHRAFVPNWFIIGDISLDLKICNDLRAVNKFLETGEIQTIPIAKYICSIGAFVWIFMFAIGYSIYNRRKEFLCSSILIILLLLTYLLGSLVMVRYYLILFFAFPIIVATIFNNEKFS